MHKRLSTLTFKKGPIFNDVQHLGLDLVRGVASMIGVIADDITGSNDIGIMFGKSGYVVDIYSYDKNSLNEISIQQRDVLIFDTDSRLEDSKTAYEKVYQASKDIRKAGAVQFFNKTCSVFRGNIGAEFDAMLDALEEDFAIIVLGFPRNGRETKHSIHYVYGQKLEESEFKNDPVNPMTESNLVHILQSQTKRHVGVIHDDVIKRGAEAISEEVQRLKGKKAVNYLILDVETQKDLFEIAKAVHEEKIICGSSAIAEEIPKVKERAYKKEPSVDLPPLIKQKGIFCAAGSLMPQTFKQVQYMKESGYTVMEFDTLTFIKLKNQKEMVDHLIKEIVSVINKGKDVIFHSSNTEEKVKATKNEGGKWGMSSTEVSRLISEAVATITSQVIKQTEQNRFVIAGGDTSATVCRALQIRGMRVWKEIQPGLPSCLSLTGQPYLFILKSGSFGKPNFIEEAIKHLSYTDETIKS